ncbi:tetratricopeptide repeat protein [Fusibacter ferrireducens]|uniref:Tetratricopeptide repeat protein n=1 Tax=Fusibacter ferrireducens TaxID=2785058 RepID=A0ABR9ZZY4_9FIRM|nr:tetratricopeptide repeat protein [Fusibacter ferrireducens]MBF4696010.1 tetratricopeptide repeat protein [Fusibacter ferrireducens]
MHIIETYLKKFLDEVVFIELKAEKKIKLRTIELNPSIPIPVCIDNLAETIKENNIEIIPPLAIIKGLIYVLGAEPEFKHVAYYVDLIKDIDIEMPLKILNDALNFASLKEYYRAILYLNACLKIDSDNLDTLYNLGRCYHDLYQETTESEYEEQSAAYFKKTVEIDPTFGLGYYQLGIFFYNRENFKQAEKLWVKALSFELDQDVKEEIVTFLGKCRDRSTYETGYELVLNGRIDEGLELLKSIEEEHGDWWNLNFFIGLAYRFQEEHETALKYFLKVLTLNTGHIQTMNEIGICLLSLGDYDEALKYYKEALRLDPLNAEIICNRGIVFLNKGDIEEARRQFERAFELNPEDEVIQMWHAHIKTVH